jgi:hypothetical protein
MQEALLLNVFVTVMLATSAPGKMTHLKGTGSAAADAVKNPLTNAKQEIVDRAPMKLARAISLPPFSMRR